jgi:hypothetical protein
MVISEPEGKARSRVPGRWSVDCVVTVHPVCRHGEPQQSLGADVALCHPGCGWSSSLVGAWALEKFCFSYFYILETRSH